MKQQFVRINSLRENKFLCGLIQLVYPYRCPVCDEIVVPFGEHICTDCMDKLRIITPPWCIKCGKKLTEDKQLCDDCNKNEHEYIRGRSLYEYPSAALSIYRFKYGKRSEYAEFYGEQIAEYLGDFIKRIQPEALVPVPLHHKRMVKRGYNQAYELAASISRWTGIPVCDDLIKRVKNTRAMKMLTGGARRENLKNAFIISRNSVKLRTIIIIDDIYTTGTTIDEVARVLRSAGVCNIYFVTLAGGCSV